MIKLRAWSGSKHDVIQLGFSAIKRLTFHMNHALVDASRIMSSLFGFSKQRHYLIIGPASNFRGRFEFICISVSFIHLASPCTVESRKFKVLGSRYFASNYQ